MSSAFDPSCLLPLSNSVVLCFISRFVINLSFFSSRRVSIGSDGLITLLSLILSSCIACSAGLCAFFDSSLRLAFDSNPLLSLSSVFARDFGFSASFFGFLLRLLEMASFSCFSKNNFCNDKQFESTYASLLSRCVLIGQVLARTRPVRLEK